MWYLIAVHLSVVYYISLHDSVDNIMSICVTSRLNPKPAKIKKKTDKERPRMYVHFMMLMSVENLFYTLMRDIIHVRKCVYLVYMHGTQTVLED